MHIIPIGYIHVNQKQSTCMEINFVGAATWKKTFSGGKRVFSYLACRLGRYFCLQQRCPPQAEAPLS